MKTSESIKEITIALFQCQSELHNIEPNAKGFNYKYATLDELLNSVKPVLLKNDIIIMQFPDNTSGEQTLTTRLQHKSGEYVESTMLIKESEQKGLSDYQVLGSGITYCRRYAISAFLGITTEEDNDAAEKKKGDKQEGTNYKKLEFDSVLSILGTINDVESLENYWKELLKEFPKMTAPQKTALQKMFANRKKSIVKPEAKKVSKEVLDIAFDDSDLPF